MRRGCGPHRAREGGRRGRRGDVRPADRGRGGDGTPPGGGGARPRGRAGAAGGARCRGPAGAARGLRRPAVGKGLHSLEAVGAR